MPYEITEPAENDLLDLWIYIAKNNLAASNRVYASLIQSFERLVEYPYLGQPRTDLTYQQVFFYSTHGYWVVYEIQLHQILILRVLNQYRDIQALLAEPH